MEIITSLQNAKVKKWTSLRQKKHRDETGLFLVEGDHLIREAMAAGCLEEIIADQPCPYAWNKVTMASPNVMKKISANVSDVHFIAVCRKQAEEPVKMERLLLLDDIQDPGNLGTLVRTAASFSYDAVFCSSNTCDLYNDKAIRSTQGALFHIPVIYTELNQQVTRLKKEGVRVIATTLENAASIDEIPSHEKMAFIIGNEGQGVSRSLQESADERLRIDMNGFESLNAAVAGGIIMYIYRKKEKK